MLPAADWHTRVQRPQHLAHQFAARGNRVFYINPHLGRQFRQPYPFSNRRLISRISRNIFEFHVHLLREPVYHERALSTGEEREIVDAILQLVELTNARPAAVLVSFPLWAGIAVSVSKAVGCRLIYDCHDLWSGFGNTGSDILSQEPELFHRSDSVLFSADWLKQHHESALPDIVGKSVIVRNAVEPHHFQFFSRPSFRKAVTIGYIGSLNFWVDYPALTATAIRHPEWTIELIGRVECAEATKLGSLPNVVLRGEVPYPLLSNHLARFDVCTIPFRSMPLTLATNPVKLYEYMACGHPIVSTNLPEVRPFSHLVGLVDESRHLTERLEEALDQDTENARQERRRTAEIETWQARCETIATQVGLRAFQGGPSLCGYS